MLQALCVEAVVVIGETEGKVCKEQSGNEKSDRQSARPTTMGSCFVRKRPSHSEQDRRVRCLEARTPWCRWAAEKVQRNRRSTSIGRKLATARVSTGTSQLAQQDKADRHTAGDPKMGKTEFL